MSDDRFTTIEEFKNYVKFMEESLAMVCENYSDLLDLAITSDASQEIRNLALHHANEMAELADSFQLLASLQTPEDL